MIVYTGISDRPGSVSYPRLDAEPSWLFPNFGKEVLLTSEYQY